MTSPTTGMLPNSPPPPLENTGNAMPIRSPMPS
jgi:hypothetical protein